MVAACSSLWALLLPAPLFAQWGVSAYTGKSFTHAAGVRVTRSPGTDLVFENVGFEDQSFTPPLYYGFRVGRAFAPFLGVEGEFIHAKVFGKVRAPSQVRGTLNGARVSGTLPLETLLQQYNISHGLNLVLANGVFRRDLTTRISLTSRTGAGFAVPHAELRAEDEDVSEYRMGRLALQLSGGVEARLHPNWYTFGEYKFTWTRSRVELPSLTVENPFLTHHVVGGIGFRF